MAKSKKKRKNIRKIFVQKKEFFFDKEAFLKELEEQTQKLFYGMIFPLEQRLDSLLEDLHNLKANVVASSTLLEKKKIFTREEFFEEFTAYGKAEGEAAVDGSGQMDGNSVFSIYDCGE